jgi:hypothetical protein
VETQPASSASTSSACAAKPRSGVWIACNAAERRGQHKFLVEKTARGIAERTRGGYATCTSTIRQRRASSEKLAGGRGLRKAQAQRI